MGFSSQAIIMGLIKQVYFIDFRINQLYQRKFKISHMATSVGTNQAKIIGGRDRDLFRVRMLDLHPSASEGPEWSKALFKNTRLNAAGNGFTAEWDGSGSLDEAAARGEQVLRVIPNNPALMQPDGSMPYAPNGAVTDPEAGEKIATKAEAKALYDAMTKGLNESEAEIDQQLEQLKAQRTALNGQREEYTKYVGEGIKMTFKNNYA